MYEDGTLTEEERELLISDLWPRVPHKVKVKFIYDKTKEDSELYRVHMDNYHLFYLGIRPYLRSMSDMTKEEMESYNDEWQRDVKDIWENGKKMEKIYKEKNYDSVWQHPATPQYRHIKWLIAHHFDFQGLIPKGLAIPATKEMYQNIE